MRVSSAVHLAESCVSFSLSWQQQLLRLCGYNLSSVSLTLGGFLLVRAKATDKPRRLPQSSTSLEPCRFPESLTVPPPPGLRRSNYSPGSAKPSGLLFPERCSVDGRELDSTCPEDLHRLCNVVAIVLERGSTICNKMVPRPGRALSTVDTMLLLF